MLKKKSEREKLLAKEVEEKNPRNWRKTKSVWIKNLTKIKQIKPTNNKENKSMHLTFGFSSQQKLYNCNILFCRSIKCV